MRPGTGVLSSFQNVPIVFAQAGVARIAARRRQGELVSIGVYRLMNSKAAARVREAIDVAD
jgi:hypothetical protein